MRKRRLKRRLAEALAAEDRAVEESYRVARRAARLRLALEAVPYPLVVRDEEGVVVLRSQPQPDGGGASPGSNLVDAAVDELVKACTGSKAVTRSMELRGPPPLQLVLRAVPLLLGAERLGTVAMVDDVSERRQLEAVRRDFVANVSHELRTPIGALALLGEALAGETDLAVVSRLAERITAEADRAAKMIEDLLDLSRIEADGLASQGLVSVVALVLAAVERVRPIAQQRKVRLVASDDGAAGIDVPGAEAQLVSAVANLIDNAVKYSDPGASVKVRARVADDFVEIAVRDRGIGIPTRDLERIFERFYRVDRARSRGTGGTGLGLSIVRHVATNHGGEVTVESREGEGSTFTLRLPAIQTRDPSGP